MQANILFHYVWIRANVIQAKFDNKDDAIENTFTYILDVLSERCLKKIVTNDVRNAQREGGKNQWVGKELREKKNKD